MSLEVSSWPICNACGGTGQRYYVNAGGSGMGNCNQCNTVGRLNPCFKNLAAEEIDRDPTRLGTSADEDQPMAQRWMNLMVSSAEHTQSLIEQIKNSPATEEQKQKLIGKQNERQARMDNLCTGVLRRDCEEKNPFRSSSEWAPFPVWLVPGIILIFLVLMLLILWKG